MNALDWVVLTGAVAVAWPCACRVNALRLMVHRTDVVVMHNVLGLGVMWSAYHALTGTAGIVELCSVVVAALWIAISYWSWRRGVPAWVHRQPPRDAAPAAPNGST